MRPLALQLENFTSFRTRQVIDFSGSDLFAIAGPTGSGKSSLLDAIVFALYGRVPRMGRSCSEMISLGRDRMTVVLDFRCGEKAYRVTRVLRRNGRGTETHLDRIIGGRDEPIADGVRRVDEEIQRIVGLGYDAFTQAVILPQGEFARFLKSKPAERQEILRDLLRLQVYEKMRLAAGRQAAALEQEVRGWEAVLESEYAGATPEAIHTLEEARAALALAKGRLAAQVSEGDAALQDLRRRCTLTLEKGDVRRRLDALVAQVEDIARLQERVEAAQRALEVVPRLDAAFEAGERARHDDARAVEGVRREVAAREAHLRGTQRLDQATRATGEVEALDLRIASLAEAVTLAGLLADASVRVSQARAGHLRARTENDAARAAAEAARLSLTRLVESAAAAESQVAKIAYDPARHAHLDALRDQAAAIPSLREAVRRTGAQRLGAEAECGRAQTAAVEAASGLRDAEEVRTDAEEARLRADRALRQAEQDHAVTRLRHELEPGDPCPVCVQTVASVPDLPHPVDLGALGAACREAAASERAARGLESEARSQHAAAFHALEQADVTLARLSEDETEASAALDHAVHALWRQAGAHLRVEALGFRKATVAALEPVGASAGGGGSRRGARPPQRRSRPLPLFESDEPLDESDPDRESPEGRGEAQAPEGVERLLLEALATLGRLQHEHTAATLARDQAQRALEKARADVDKRAELQAMVERAERDATRALTEAEAAAAVLQARIGAIATGDDPSRERLALVQRRTGLLESLEAAREAERHAATELATATAQAEGATLRAAESKTAALAGAAAAEAAAREAGFADAGAARLAALPRAELEQARRNVDAHHREREACLRRVAEIEAELGGVEVSPGSLDDAEASARLTRSHHEDAVRREAALEQRLQELRARAESARVRQEQLVLLRGQQGLQKQLAADLRSDAFQAYLLEESFRELVKGASLRLFELSGRYTLEFQDDAFHVLDHDNARERRSAETLSGGETFLASLALALELCQEVQRAAGALDLESLFIDEGFGTLDPDTLETITDAILGLPEAGRMVGIITHISELTERLPVCLHVAKRLEGSTVTVRR